MEQMLPFLGIITSSFLFKQFPHHFEHHQGNGNAQKNTPLQCSAILKKKTIAISEVRFMVLGFFCFFCTVVFYQVNTT